ncbi:MAG: hypothetical protein HXX14_20455 [Bacteroidetes bacterium]|nr:hypothetical protein [Bacteroidota bacterium]NWJ53225.1 hypothetical protein [Bacteroidota bacterium]
MKTIERIILIDADVVSHFIYAGEILSLPTIFKNKIFILDKVYAELQRFPKRKVEIDNILNFKLLEIMPFPEDNIEIKKEYAFLKKFRLKGDGESACMAVARYTNNILASSNLKDTAEYCKMHRVDYLTTMDFLYEAFRINIFSLERCNTFISKVKASGNKLPVNRLEDFKYRDLGFVF